MKLLISLQLWTVKRAVSGARLHEGWTLVTWSPVHVNFSWQTAREQVDPDSRLATLALVFFSFPPRFHGYMACTLTDKCKSCSITHCTNGADVYRWIFIRRLQLLSALTHEKSFALHIITRWLCWYTRRLHANILFSPQWTPAKGWNSGSVLYLFSIFIWLIGLFEKKFF